LKTLPPFLLATWAVASFAVALDGCGRSGLDEAVEVTGGAGHVTGGGSGALAGASGQAGGGAGQGGAGGFATGGFGGFVTVGAGGFATAGAGGFATAGAGGFATAGAGGFATAGAGGAVGCVEGMNSCAGPQTGQICLGGEPVTFMCPMGCFAGVCAECEPGTSICATVSSVQACNAAGFLQPPVPCDNVCENGACVACTEGATRCASPTAQQTCAGGVWRAGVQCPFVCVGNACGRDPKNVFVIPFLIEGGTIGGLDIADSLCQLNSAHLPGTFRAWLSDSKGSPATRFTKQGGPYQLVDGTVIANNWSDLTSGKIRHPIDLLPSGGMLTLIGQSTCQDFPPVWSNTQANGTALVPSLDCGDWTDPNAQDAAWGDLANTDGSWTDACRAFHDPTPACHDQAAFYCFEQ
jgi:hypothetical protein